jgi:hypothetical protein
MAPPRKTVVTPGAQRKRDHDWRKRLGLKAGCRMLKYSVGTAYRIASGSHHSWCYPLTPERAQFVPMPDDFTITKRDDKHYFANYRAHWQCNRVIDTKMFGNASGMTDEQAFDAIPNDDPRERRGHWSTVPRPYHGGPPKDEYELPAHPQHPWPHREIRWPLIEAGIVPTEEEHRQRQKRLGFVGKWWISRNPKHADYHLAALADACENVCSRSRAPILSDETPDVAIPDTIVDFGGLRGTQEQDVGVYTELYTSVGVRKFTSIEKAHYQPSEPGPVSEDRAEWEAEAERLKKKMYQPPLGRTAKTQDGKCRRARGPTMTPRPLPMALAA